MKGDVRQTTIIKSQSKPFEMKIEENMFKLYLALELINQRTIFMPYRLLSLSHLHQEQKLFKLKYRTTQFLNIISNLLSLSSYRLDVNKTWF